VLGRLWQLDADTVMRAMCMLYERDAASIFRIFDVAQARLSARLLACRHLTTTALVTARDVHAAQVRLREHLPRL